MSYVVLYKTSELIPHMDQWFDSITDAEKRCRELQLMFDWMHSMKNNKDDSCLVWVECIPMN